MFACGYRRAFGTTEIAGIFAGIRSIPAKALPATPLTDTQIRNAKPTERQFKLSDGGWLFLVVMPSGLKLWRMAYRFNGIEKTLSFGGYPEVSLKDARTRRDEAKALVKQGIDPSQKRKLDKLSHAASMATTFGGIAEEYLEKQRRNGRSERTLEKGRWLLALARPALWDRPIAEIRVPPELCSHRVP